MALAYGVWESGSEAWYQQRTDASEEGATEGGGPSLIDVVASANVIKVLLWASIAANVGAVCSAVYGDDPPLLLGARP
eukprot:757235-Rhodomonas_salina.1